MKREDVKFIVVHCSRTTRRYGDGLATVERKCRQRGALSCGYHFVISRAGTVETGRPLDEAGNHLLGYNAQSIAICLVGMPGQATGKQKRALRELLVTLRAEYPDARVATHEELHPASGRGCPGFTLDAKMRGA